MAKAARAAVKAIPRSVAHRESTIEWLREDVTHGAALLEAALETGDAGDFMAALRLIAEARGGIAKIAEMTGLNREALYRTLSKRGNPQSNQRSRGLTFPHESYPCHRAACRHCRLLSQGINVWPGISNLSQ